MSAAALFAVSRGLELASGINSAFQDQATAQFQSQLMQRQMEEIETRTQMDQRNISARAEKITAGQQAAFISGGVSLSGSAMSVISDTLNDAAQAAYVKQREAEYDLVGIAVQKNQLDRAASNETLMLKMASAGIGAGAGFGKDMYSYNKASATASKRGADGLGEPAVDKAGGTTNYSTDYLNM